MTARHTHFAFLQGSREVRPSEAYLQLLMNHFAGCGFRGKFIPVVELAVELLDQTFAFRSSLTVNLIGRF